MLMSALMMMADNRPLAEMQAIAASKLNSLAAERGLRHAPVHADALRCIADRETYAVFSTEATTGFVIVAKSTLADPLIGYSSEPFDTDCIPANMQWYLSEVNRNLQAIEAGEAQMPSRTATYTPVENFVTTKWHQDKPFNMLTPNNYPTGCTATAMAQFMNYCQYPSRAEFDSYYYIIEGDNIEEKKAHVSSTYTWPYKDTYTGTADDNIAKLLRDCGYAAETGYSSEGSGSHLLYAGIAFVDYFGYSEQCIKLYLKEHFKNKPEEWEQIIYDELASRSPIIYGALDAQYGGHAFVFSGVDNDGLIYINWGWGGNSNGFFNLDALYVRSYYFSEDDVMVTGIRTTPLETDHVAPRFLTNDGKPYTFSWGIVSDEKNVNRNTLIIDLPSGYMNFTPVTFKGVFGLFAQDLTDGSIWVIAEDLQDRYTIPSFDGGTNEHFYYIDGNEGLKAGHTYRMSFGTKDDREGTWNSIFSDDGEIGYDITYTGDIATSTISEVPTAAPVMTGIKDIYDSTNDHLQIVNGKTFDLTGRTIANGAIINGRLPKGLYIQNGKKILVR